MTQAFNRDCMEAMKEFPDKFFDLAVVDPPYGIGITGTPGGNKQYIPFGGVHGGGTARIGGAKPFGAKGEDRGGYCVPPKSYHAFNDQKPPDASYFEELKRVSKNQIIWGGNYFLDNLGSTPCMLFWDKGRTDIGFADGEFAWTSFKSPARRFLFKWNGMLQQDMKNKEFRIHPTQKPVRLYEWIFDHYARAGDKILDTHLGSGSSRIAAYNRGLDFWGYEIDKVYFDLQEKRFEEYTAQGNLFLMET